ncbi:MAG: DUF4338 domain-containing protein [Anaerolineae bacterium]
MTTSADELREAVLKELETLGFELHDGELFLPEEQTKEFYRKLHEPAKRVELKRRQDWLRRKLPDYLDFFADGDEVKPERIEPVLVEVKKKEQRELFRMARLTWSLPYSKGFGRRLTYLVMDEQNGKLIGILRLQSPPLAFPPRDELFDYPDGRKSELINQTMDIQTLGALPPYSRLLGGKLVAMAAASNEVRADYRHKYEGRETVMKERVLPAHLVALTTTSAFGRSSLYNRLRYHDEMIAESLGYTEGYGSFHLLRLYPQFREFLEERDVSTRGGYGTGPRRKWQTMVRALNRLGFSSEMLRHGIKREAFLFPLIHNLEAYMAGRDDEPDFRDLRFEDLVSYWHDRWLVGRVERVDGWRDWQRSSLKERLLLERDGQE